MRLALLGLLLPLAACVSAEPAPQVAGAAAVVADAGPSAAARPPVTSPPNSTVQVDAKAEPKKICWTETVTGTRGRKQTVCRTEGYERNGQAARDSLKSMQDRSGASGPPPIMGGG